MRIHNQLSGYDGLNFWHHRVPRDVTLAGVIQSSSLQQQQKENAKEALVQQGSSTEITMDQPQGIVCFINTIVCPSV